MKFQINKIKKKTHFNLLKKYNLLIKNLVLKYKETLWDKKLLKKIKIIIIYNLNKKLIIITIFNLNKKTKKNNKNLLKNRKIIK